MDCETNNVNGPLLISILILSVLVNLMCFIVIAKLVKSARKQDQNSPLNRLARAFSTQESQRPDVAAPEIKDEERPIIKNDNELTKPTLSKEVWLEDSDGNVAKL